MPPTSHTARAGTVVNVGWGGETSAPPNQPLSLPQPRLQMLKKAPVPRPLGLLGCKHPSSLRWPPSCTPSQDGMGDMPVTG